VNALASTMCAIAAQWRYKEDDDPGVSITVDIGSSFFFLPSMVGHLIYGLACDTYFFESSYKNVWTYFLLEGDEAGTLSII
jgi:hypothetical protein